MAGLRASRGAGGRESSGYMVNLQRLFVLGSKAEELPVGVFEMKHLYAQRLDGLLGGDVIRAFHLEMNGPQGELRVY